MLIKNIGLFSYGYDNYGSVGYTNYNDGNTSGGWYPGLNGPNDPPPPPKELADNTQAWFSQNANIIGHKWLGRNFTDYDKSFFGDRSHDDIKKHGKRTIEAIDNVRQFIAHHIAGHEAIKQIYIEKLNINSSEEQTGTWQDALGNNQIDYDGIVSAVYHGSEAKIQN